MTFMLRDGLILLYI